MNANGSQAQEAPKIRIRSAEPPIPEELDADIAIPAEWGDAAGLIDGKLYRLVSLGGRRWELEALLEDDPRNRMQRYDGTVEKAR